MSESSEESKRSQSGLVGWLMGLAVCAAIVVVLTREQSAPPGVKPPPAPAVPSLPSPIPPSAPAPAGAAAVPGSPVEVRDQGYVGEARCRSCHEDQHDSWHHSYHRTMTRQAGPESVIGEFGVTLRHGSNNPPVRLTRDGDRFLVELVGQQVRDANGATRPARFPIALTTGSHHMQVYWAPIGRDRTVVNVPFVYLRASKEWIPWGSCFLQPPNEAHDMYPASWNKDCVHCHTTHGQPREQSVPGAYDTVAAEFGISCEACHGPGERHVAYREADREAPMAGDPIVNPATLDHRLSSQVCGACHSFNTERIDVARPEFRPGQDLHAMRQVIRFDAVAQAEIRSKTPDKALAEQAIQKISHMFWPDGIARVTGREYTGMMDSACHVNGTMSCVSCHRMHQSKNDPRGPSEWADDQLDHRRLSDGACTQCHETDRYQSPAHTHHAAGSVGAECMNCHMPHTSWGLLRGLRSHRVNSPDIGRDLAAGRPNACNLCHLDKSIDWSAQRVSEWWGTKPPATTDEQKRTAAGVLWALKGDAGVRALMAWHFAWPPAQKASGSDWAPPYLSILLKDDYDAVRYVARRSLKTFPGYEGLEFDFLAPWADRERVGAAVLDQWERSGAKGAGRGELLIDSDGRLRRAEVERMLTQRDVSPVYLIE